MDCSRCLASIKRETDPFVLLLVGVPTSGKDTFLAKYKVREFATVISMDEIIESMFPDKTYDEAYKALSSFAVIKGLMEEQIHRAVSQSKNLVINTTNLTSKRRQTTLDMFPRPYKKFCAVFPSPDISEFKKRNEARAKLGKTVPLDAYVAYLCDFQMPTKNEGFDAIFSFR